MAELWPLAGVDVDCQRDRSLIEDSADVTAQHFSSMLPSAYIGKTVAEISPSRSSSITPPVMSVESYDDRFRLSFRSETFDELVGLRDQSGGELARITVWR